ncbi:MAG: methylenetetrahydrofolate reductase [NAD(P)H] [bacterium]|nr:methylenetetrahydrofolate reductase [NAD(P)H] [bacterium]MCP5070406.1 methylenetetrahydrofolate reductase [NAD(P)H] [bacterium]
MRIAELYQAGTPVFSFEFFPPKTDTGYRTLYRTVEDLKNLNPGFVSVTCGAQGSTRSKTADLVVRIQNELGLTAMAHMTCTGQTREELALTLGQLHSGSIRNVLALRGDPPVDQPDWRPVPGGFRHANELTAFIKSHFDLSVAGACYPEKHPEATSLEQDLANLRLKVEAGAEFLITQLFLDDADYFSFLELARAHGIDVPIVPGIMPMVSLKNLRGAMRLSPGSKTPSELEDALSAAGDDAERSLEVGIGWATAQCRKLLAGGAPGIHFYTLNKSPATRQVTERLLAG